MVQNKNFPYLKIKYHCGVPCYDDDLIYNFSNKMLYRLFVFYSLNVLDITLQPFKVGFSEECEAFVLFVH